MVCGGSTDRSCLTLMTGKVTQKLKSTRRYILAAVSLPSGVYILGVYHALATSSFLPNAYSEWESGPILPGTGNYDACAVALSGTKFLLIGGYPTTRQVAEYNTTIEE